MEKFWIWLAWKMPRPLAYWAFIRVATYAGMGKYSGEETPAIAVTDAMVRWLDGNE